MPDSEPIIVCSTALYFLSRTRAREFALKANAWLSDDLTSIQTQTSKLFFTKNIFLINSIQNQTLLLQATEKSAKCSGTFSKLILRIVKRNVFLRGRLRTINILLLTFFRLVASDNIVQTLFIYSFTNKTRYLNEEVNGTEPSPSISVPSAYQSV